MPFILYYLELLSWWFLGESKLINLLKFPWNYKRNLEMIPLIFWSAAKIENIHRSGFPLVGGTGGDPPAPRKIGLSPHVPPPLWPQNADFVIFMQFLAIVLKLSPHQPTPFGKPCRQRTELLIRFSGNSFCLRDRLQISLLILSEFNQINSLLFSMKSSENQRFSDDFRGNRS